MPTAIYIEISGLCRLPLYQRHQNECTPNVTAVLESRRRLLRFENENSHIMFSCECATHNQFLYLVSKELKTECHCAARCHWDAKVPGEVRKACQARDSARRPTERHRRPMTKYKSMSDKSERLDMLSILIGCRAIRWRDDAVRLPLPHPQTFVRDCTSVYNLSAASTGKEPIEMIQSSARLK